MLYSHRVNEQRHGCGIPLLFAQICFHSPCYRKSKLCKEKKWPTFFFLKGKSREVWDFLSFLFKTCCVWMKLACNHTDHKERKYSVLPFNPVMAYKQNGILWSGPHKSSEKEIVLHTTSTTFPSFSGEGDWAVVAGDTVRSRAEHSLRCVLEPICLNYTNCEYLCFCRDSTRGICCFSYWPLFK